MGKPRHQCLCFCEKHNGDREELSKEDFDALCREKQFVIGPLKDAFGDAALEPYNPNRQVFGKLKDGRIVYAELVT